MELIDGHPVIEHQVRFRRRAIIDDYHSNVVRDGDVVVWIVRARCLPPQYHAVAREADDRYKLSVQDVEDVVPLTGRLRDSAITYLDHGEDDFGVVAGNGASPPAHPGEQHLRDLLSAAGQLGDDETPLEAVQRLLNDAAPTRPVDAATVARHVETPNEPAPPPSNGDVEVVGSIYRGRRSSTRDLLEQHFGGPT